jgi:hypothetical protein
MLRIYNEKQSVCLLLCSALLKRNYLLLVVQKNILYHISNVSNTVRNVIASIDGVS